MQDWEDPASIEDVNDQEETQGGERPRKKRRKYIARAWYAAVPVLG